MMVERERVWVGSTLGRADRGDAWATTIEAEGLGEMGTE